VTREPIHMPQSQVSTMRPYDLAGSQRWLNSRWGSLLAVGLFMISSTLLPSVTLACGWWGDGENDSNSEAITIGSEGQIVDRTRQANDTPETLTTQANKLRQYGTSGYAGAVRLYRQAAQKGYAPAQNNLGAMYEYGLGVVADLSEASLWYQRAAEQGESHAQHSLGEMLLSGRGIKQNTTKGIYWIEQAANQNHASACARLGKLYATGKYLDRDIEKALFWWNRAQLLDYPNASQEVSALRSTDKRQDSASPTTGE